MNPKCNLTEEEQAEALSLFTGALTADHEREIRILFHQYLFCRDELPDDGWNVGDKPVRMCTCTACGTTFTAGKGEYYPKKPRYDMAMDCPVCGATVTVKAVRKMGYEMSTVYGWVKAAAAYTDGRGALLIEAGNCGRGFTHDDLTGELRWNPDTRYYFRAGKAQMWKHTLVRWGADNNPVYDWKGTKTVYEPFGGLSAVYWGYDGTYRTAGLREALDASELKYCGITDWMMGRFSLDPANGDLCRLTMKYLGWWCHYPKIEIAVKLKLGSIVTELVEDGRKNAKDLNWSASTPDGFLRLSRRDAKDFIRSGLEMEDLKLWKETAKGESMDRFLDMLDRAGGRENLKEISACAKAAGTTAEKGVRYIESLMPECAAYAPPRETIIRTWKDYLNMAAQLGYDLKESTVAMPKDLQARHDAAAETVRVEAAALEKKKYEKRRKKLEKIFGFSMGGLRVIVPKSAREIVNEGKTLHHCVGGYAARHVDGQTTILFLRRERRPERSYITIEMRQERKGWWIVQVHGYRNEGYGARRRAQDRFAWFLNPWLDWVNDGSPRDKAGAPIIREKEMAV